MFIKVGGKMSYNKKPEMILFDVGGTLFDDGKCKPTQGFEALRLKAENPYVTTAEKLASRWDEFLNEIGKLKSESGVILDVPLSAVIKYATMQEGLKINLPSAEQEEIFDRFNSTRNVVDGVPELLEALKKINIRTAVISNNMMSGESLSLAIKHWIPSANFEFCLTSADVLFTKPYKEIFNAAANFAGLDTTDCWYCGDGRVPDVDGAKNSSMTPVLLDVKSHIPFEYRTDGGRGEYLVVNHWNELGNYINKLSE